MSINSKELGYIGEKAVCEYLYKKGYQILKRNFCIRGGEIDIIASKDDVIAFVEVKTRQLNNLAGGFEAVTKSKQRFIIKTAAAYMVKYHIELQPRFDVAEILVDTNNVPSKIHYIENAFDTSGYDIFY